MFNKPLPKGLFQPLEEGDRQDQVWTPEMRLSKDSPSWMWKKTRLHLASGEGKNKAGRKKGAGCTSKARMEKRRGIPQKRRGILQGLGLGAEAAQAAGATLGKGYQQLFGP